MIKILYKKWRIVLLLFSLLLVCCRKDPPLVPPVEPPPYQQSIFLAIADSGLTEVYLSLSMTDTIPPRGFEIFRNNVKILTGSLIGRETTLVDMTAQMNTSYIFQAFRVDDAIRKDSSAIVATKTLDTTSHEFTWTEYVFGNFSPNNLKDVDIDSESSIYAVGVVTNRDSHGNTIEYNLLKFENEQWTLNRIMTDARILFPGSIGSESLFVDGRAIFIRSKEDYWVAAGNMHHIVNSQKHEYKAEDAGLGIGLWGDNKNNIWSIYYAGKIVKYNGTSWQGQFSGTTVDLRDIWGTPDGSTVWACGYSSDGTRSILLEYKNGSWNTMWERDGGFPVSPFEYRVTSVWYKKYLYISSRNRVYRIKNGQTQTISSMFSSFIKKVRGNNENDMIVITDESAIWHFNGCTWKKIFSDPQKLFSSIAIKNNIVVAVGTDYSTFPSKAVIVKGLRIN